MPATSRSTWKGLQLSPAKRPASWSRPRRISQKSPRWPTGEVQRSDSPCQAAVKVQRELLGKASRKMATNLCWLGRLYKEQGDCAGRTGVPSGIGDPQTALGENHPVYATCLGELAGLYQAKGDYPRAETLYRTGPGDPEESPRGEPSRLCRQPEQSRRAVSRAGRLRRRPNCFSVRPWRSRKEPSVRTIPVMRSA